jgi:putative ABC transport system permease protein
MGAYFEMFGAFNDLTFTLAPNGNLSHAKKAIDRILENYGGLGAYGKDRLPSYSFLRDEFKQLKTTALMLPLIFLAVAAFLLHIVATRIISRQREQIASLKALGYTNTTTALHYVKLMLLISGSGALLGVAFGWYLGKSMTNLYGEYYRFPNLVHLFHPTVALTGLLIGALAGIVGTIFSVRRVLRMQPAQAMRPPMPETFGRASIERWLRHLSSTAKMSLRNLLRRPMRTLFSITGLAMAVMIMVLGLFMGDSVKAMLDIQFELLNRESMTISFIRPVAAAVLDELTTRPGVLATEGYRQVPVRLRHRQLVKEIVLTGMPPNSKMRRIADQNQHVMDVPVSGIALNSVVAKKLQIEAGDLIQLEILEGNRRRIATTVVKLIDELLGQGAYMQLGELQLLLGESATVNTAVLQTDPAQQTPLLANLKNSSVIASLQTRESTLKVFYETMSRSTLAMVTIILLFAGAISVGVVYNTAMILLSERTFELGSLRILGFTKREVFTILVSELGAIVLASLIPGCLLGYGFAAFLMNSVETEGFTLPLLISNRTYVTAILTSIVTAMATFVILYLRIRRMDLVSVLKVRE